MTYPAVEDAARLADEVLWPASLEIDAAARVPVAYLDALADAGLYGIRGPRDAGGLDLPDEASTRVTEMLAGASLSTAFVWTQHHSPLRAVAISRPEVRDRWLADLCRGKARAGHSFAALRRPGPPAMVATPEGDGFTFTGSAPWVTGWGLVDVVLFAARHEDEIVWGLVDAVVSPTLTITLLELSAVNSSATVEVEMAGHPVPEDRVVLIEPVDDWKRRDVRFLARNGHLSVGLAERCARLLESQEMANEVEAARAALLTATPETVVSARTAASLLSLRGASAFMAASGGRGVTQGHQAQRLMREASFLLVFGQTRAIREAQLSTFMAPPRGG